MRAIESIMDELREALSDYGSEENIGFFMVLADGETFTDLDGCSIVEYPLSKDIPETVDDLKEVTRF